MRERRYFHIAFILLLLLAGLPIRADGQSLVKTLDFRPPGVQNQVGFDYRIAVIESTGLVYVGSTGAYGEDVGVIHPGSNKLVATIPVPADGSYYNLMRANQATMLLYLRMLNSNQVAVVDGRPASPTFHQALPAIMLPDIVQSFAIDESSGLMYLTMFNYGDESHDPQSRVCVVDLNPGSGTFHQVLREIFLPSGAWPRGVAVNPINHKVYIAATGTGAGVYVLQGTTLSLIAGTAPSFGVVVNENANLVYATANGNRMNAIDGTTDSLLQVIDLPGAILQGNFDLRMAVNRVSGRVYVRSNEIPAPDKLVVVDGKRSSPTFNTVLGTVEVGRNGSAVVVDEGLNRVVTNSMVDLRTYIVDGSTNTVMQTVPSAQIPSGLGLNRVTHRAYVANQLHSVQVINLHNNKLGATVVTATELGSGVVNPANHLLYFSLTSGTSGVRTVDKNGNLGMVTSLPTTAGRYLYTAINRNTNRVYVQNGGATVAGDAMLPGFVSAVSGKKVVASVTTGNQPFGLAANETTNKIYSLDAGLGGNFPSGITVIDGATNTTLQADTSAFPAGTTFLGDSAVNDTTNKLYFGNGYSMGTLNGYTNVATPLPDSLAPVTTYVVSKALNRIYITNQDSNLLYVLDGASDAEIATLSINSPQAVAVNEATGRIYVVSEADKSVTVIDGASNTPLATIQLGASQGTLAINELANRVYVYSGENQSVYFINGANNTVETTLALPSLPFSNRAVSIVADAGVARVYVLEVNGNGRLFILSDTGGTLAALKQAIISATAGDPIVRLSMLAKFGLAQTALARNNIQAGVIALQSLEHETESQRGKTLTNAEADKILALTDAVIASVS